MRRLPLAVLLLLPFAVVDAQETVAEQDCRRLTARAVLATEIAGRLGQGSTERAGVAEPILQDLKKLSIGDTSAEGRRALLEAIRGLLAKFRDAEPPLTARRDACQVCERLAESLDLPRTEWSIQVLGLSVQLESGPGYPGASVPLWIETMRRCLELSEGDGEEAKDLTRHLRATADEILTLPWWEEPLAIAHWDDAAGFRRLVDDRVDLLRTILRAGPDRDRLRGLRDTLPKAVQAAIRAPAPANALALWEVYTLGALLAEDDVLGKEWQAWLGSGMADVLEQAGLLRMRVLFGGRTPESEPSMDVLKATKGKLLDMGQDRVGSTELRVTVFEKEGTSFVLPALKTLGLESYHVMPGSISMIEVRPADGGEIVIVARWTKAPSDLPMPPRLPDGHVGFLGFGETPDRMYLLPRQPWSRRQLWTAMANLVASEDPGAVAQHGAAREFLKELYGEGVLANHEELMSKITRDFPEEDAPNSEDIKRLLGLIRAGKLTAVRLPSAALVKAISGAEWVTRRLAWSGDWFWLTSEDWTEYSNKKWHLRDMIEISFQ